MTNETADEPHRVPPRAYPSLDPAQLAAINAKLVAIAALRHPGKLITAQLANLTVAMEPQTHHLETFIAFPSGTRTSPPSSARPWGMLDER
jgi:hypothetical protein